MNMIDQDSQTEETVTLLLQTKRFKINKKKLIAKSRYFAALLSTTYKDYLLSEHVINYEIPTTSFQDFVNWIDNDGHDIIIKLFFKDNLGRLLILLELSVLFAADNLIEIITFILEKDYLLPENVLNIWLLVQELGLKQLQDLCLAVCLDRFTELPLNLIYKLSKQCFLKLIGNINLRVANISDTESYLSHIIQSWMKINQDTIPLDILKKTEPKMYPSIISCDNSNSIVNNVFYLHCWDGDKLFEFTTFTYPKDVSSNKNALIGMQFTARGYNLYLSGGEYGIGLGRFNMNVWRYSLISKNWIIETIMPCARRHMIAAFVQNKLLLAGGVGLHRRKLRSFDIYNVHKGTWLKGMELPTDLEFVTPPDYHIFDRKLIICFRYIKLRILPVIYIYNSEENDWCKVQANYELHQHISELRITTPIMNFKTASCYIDKNKPDKINLKSIIMICNSEHNRKIFEQIITKIGIDEKIVYNIYFYLMHLHNDSYETNVLICLKNEEYLICAKENENLQWHSMPIQNLNKFRSLFSELDTVFFNLMDLAHLHTTTSIANLDCIT